MCTQHGIHQLANSRLVFLLFFCSSFKIRFTFLQSDVRVSWSCGWIALIDPVVYENLLDVFSLSEVESSLTTVSANLESQQCCVFSQVSHWNSVCSLSRIQSIDAFVRAARTRSST